MGERSESDPAQNPTGCRQKTVVPSENGVKQPVSSNRVCTEAVPGAPD